MDEAQPELAVDPFVGRTLEGKYLVEELLGWGAMGSVYRARQVALDRTVALKVMSPSLAKDPDFVARFHREAKTASRLWHPNTVSVTDFGEAADGLLYLVMELVPGRNLDEVIQQEFPLGDARVVSIVSQLLSAVGAAHDLGIIHRDLKPENLLVVRGVDDEGGPLDTVKVCDFGLARGLGAEVEETSTTPSTMAFGPKLTTVGLILGTPAYMSPEQAAGLPPDRRSDLYAVGAILFELLTREVPFDRETAADMVLAHISDVPRDPRDLAPDCNPALAALCLRALAKQPNDRPQTARAMRAAVQRALTYPDETTFPSLDDARTPESSFPSSSLRTNRQSEIRTAKPPATRTTASAVPSADRVVLVPRRRWPLAAVLGLVGIAGAGYLVGHRRSGSFIVPPVSVSVARALPTPLSTTPAVVAATPSAVAAVSTVSVVSACATRDLPRGRAATAKVPAPPSIAVPAVQAFGEPPAPPPAVEAPVAAPVPVPPPAVEPAPVAAPPPYSVERASVAITIGEVSGTSRATVGALVSHVAMTDCYQNALRALGRPEGGQGTMHLDFDEDGVITASSVKLPPALSAAAECFRSRMQRQRLGRPPDTGSASGDLVIKLTP